MLPKISLSFLLHRSSLRTFSFAFLGLLTLAVAASHAQQIYQPVANAKAVVVDGQARFTVLTPQLIRMEWSADGKFEDRPSFVVLSRQLAVPFFKKSTEGQDLVLTTTALELRYHKGSGKFTPENLTVKFKLDGTDHTWQPGAVTSGNLMGTARTLDGVRGEAVKLEQGLVSRDGWAVIDDSQSPLFDSDDFRLNSPDSTWPWVVERSPGERQDWYFLGYGHDYKQALGDYTRISGKIPMPPRFAFGTWWSRYWDYSDAELRDLVAQFHEHKVPLDVLVIDMGWHLNPDAIKEKGFDTSKDNFVDQSGHSTGWSGYTWNPKYFPEPETFLAWVHQQGLKATLNLHPASGVQPWEKAYPEMAKAMGIDPTTNKYVPFDLTNKKFATNYLNLLHHPLEQQGIDFWWLDWQQEMKTQLANVNPTFWLNYVHFSDQQREGKRPIIFHRWGGLGNHRYVIGFSGDTVSVWDSLAFQPYFTAAAANVGYSYWSHDIGGHMPGAVDGEIYSRWIQFGTFSPILRTHTTKNPDAERRIWAYPKPYSDIMRDAFLLRYAIQPYLYTESRKTYDSGVAFLRPLYYDYPDVKEAYEQKSEYTFGDSMIVSPIVAPADPTTLLASKSIWLPKGEWVEWFTGKQLTGPGNFDRTFTEAQIPVYVKAGSILPQQPEMSFTGEKPVDPLILEVFPFGKDQHSSTYRLYEDSSIGENYTRSEFAWTNIEVKHEWPRQFDVSIAAAQGSYLSMPSQRSLEVRLWSDSPPAEVKLGGKKLAAVTDAQSAGWRYDKDKSQVIVRTPRRSVYSKTVLSIKLEGDPQPAAR
jgi:alpha-glucosidase (family GH31 glycosyl hydrolase)